MYNLIERMEEDSLLIKLRALERIHDEDELRLAKPEFLGDYSNYIIDEFIEKLDRFFNIHKFNAAAPMLYENMSKSLKIFSDDKYDGDNLLEIDEMIDAINYLRLKSSVMLTVKEIKELLYKLKEVLIPLTEEIPEDGIVIDGKSLMSIYKYIHAAGDADVNPRNFSKYIMVSPDLSNLEELRRLIPTMQKMVEMQKEQHIYISKNQQAKLKSALDSIEPTPLISDDDLLNINKRLKNDLAVLNIPENQLSVREVQAYLDTIKRYLSCVKIRKESASLLYLAEHMLNYLNRIIKIQQVVCIDDPFTDALHNVLMYWNSLKYANKYKPIINVFNTYETEPVDIIKLCNSNLLDECHGYILCKTGFDNRGNFDTSNTTVHYIEVSGEVMSFEDAKKYLVQAIRWIHISHEFGGKHNMDFGQLCKSKDTIIPSYDNVCSNFSGEELSELRELYAILVFSLDSIEDRSSKMQLY